MSKIKHVKQKIVIRLRFFFIAFWYSIRHPVRFFRALETGRLLKAKTWKKFFSWPFATKRKRMTTASLAVILAASFGAYKYFSRPLPTNHWRSKL